MKQTELKKKAFLEALEQSLGVITTACQKSKVGKSTYYDWLKSDSEFALACNEVENVALDFAESQLYKLIREGNITAIIFYLKTKGKKRGYSERQEIQVKNGGVYIDVERRKAKFA